MAIHYVRIKGRIKDGKIEAELPENVLDGEVELLVQTADTVTDVPNSEWDNLPWTEAELDELLKPNPMTLGELLESGLLGGWKDRPIADSQEFIEQQRHAEAEKRGIWKLS
jgi:hypothetical protein